MDGEQQPARADERRPARADRAPRQRLDVPTRRAAILDAAMAAFGEAPYPQVRVADVAGRAMASPALVFRYFDSKAGLYAAVVQRSADLLLQRQLQADAALPPGVPVRDRVRASLEVYLDHIAGHPSAWANPLVGGEEPTPAVQIRTRLREEYVDRLRQLLHLTPWPRHEFALRGYFGFVDQACLAWVQAGCPADRRHPLIDAALGALEGALGDWGS